MADAHANFAVSTVATAPSPASSGTSLVVAAGEGARFPTAPFNATVCPVSADPTPVNAEIVRVTARATDTLTITRATESTSARTVVVGDRIYAGVTAKTLTDVEAGTPPTGSAGGSLTGTYPNPTLAYAPNENAQTGILAPTCKGWAGVTTALTANRCLLARFVPTRNLAVTLMAFVVGTVGASGNKVDVGIYSSDLATRLGSSGSIVPTPNMASAGAHTAALTGTVNLTAGTVYYAAFLPDTTAGTIMGAMILNLGTAGAESLFGTAIGKFETGIKDIGAATLPSSITTPTPSSYQGPALAVRES